MKYLLLSAVLCALLAGGCVPKNTLREVPEEEMQAYLADKPEELHEYYIKVLTEEERCAVLNHMNAGIKAFRLGYYKTAKYSLDEALTRIETVYSDEENAEKAKSVWYEEGMKDFKGEPYERAMAYYYRGLLYMMDGDYENARACFKSGQLQDRMAENETFDDDFILLYVLEGWASRANGEPDLAHEAFEKIRSLEHCEGFNDIPAEHDSLVIVETGLSPIKSADGEYGQNLVMNRHPGNLVKDACIVSTQGRIEECVQEDIFFQASTRGDRAFDEVLEDKVQVKKTTDTAGTVLAATGAGMASAGMYTNNRDMGLAGLFVGIIGLAAKASAANMTPKADTRACAFLPDRVFLYTYDSKRVSAPRVKLFINNNIELEKTLEVKGLDLPGGTHLAWVRSEYSEKQMEKNKETEQ